MALLTAVAATRLYYTHNFYSLLQIPRLSLLLSLSVCVFTLHIQIVPSNALAVLSF